MKAITVTKYIPRDNEEYMNDMQLGFFKEKLLHMRHTLLEETNVIKKELQGSGANHPDLFDTASSHTEFTRELKGFNRNRLQLSKIDRALGRIDSGEYGYCEMTGEEIGLKRLKAQPLATLCIDVQEMLERTKNQQKCESVYIGY